MADLCGDYGAARVILPAPENPRFAHLSWPKIVTCGDALVLAYSAGRFHGNHGEGCPAVSVSRDGGETFSSPRILREFDATTDLTCSANTALGVAEDGAVVLLAMAFTADDRNSVFGWRSADGGASWAPVDTATLADGRTGSVYGHVFPVRGRGLAVAGHYRPGSISRTRGLWMAFSQDGGLTWGEPEPLTDEDLVEPAFTCSAGRLVGLLRDRRNQANYRQAVSDDGGRTWTLSTSPLGGEPRFRAPSPFVIADPSEPHRLFAFETLRRRDGNAPGRMDLWTADARELEWRRLGLVAEIPRAEGDPYRDFGYPWMTPLADGAWFAAFYAGLKKGPNALWGLKMKPA